MLWYFPFVLTTDLLNIVLQFWGQPNPYIQEYLIDDITYSKTWDKHIIKI